MWETSLCRLRSKTGEKEKRVEKEGDEGERGGGEGSWGWGGPTCKFSKLIMTTDSAIDDTDARGLSHNPSKVHLRQRARQHQGEPPAGDPALDF